MGERTGVGGFLEALLREALDALYPPRCAVCGAAAGSGASCARHVLPDDARRRAVPRCGRCAVRLSDALPAGTICAACRRRRPRFRRVVTLGDYHADEGLRAWILALKHGGRRDLAPRLGRALAGLLEAESDEPTAALLVPVPLHPLRRLERGLDQARLLARHTAEALDLDWQPLLRRRRWTAPQGTPGARSRRANVERAFAVRDGRPGRLRGRRVWLVDDVLTSGATAEACVTALASAGARQVGVLCLARVSPRAAGLRVDQRGGERRS